MTRLLICVGYWLGLTLSVYPQPTNLGLPSLRNFDKGTYQGGTQTWDFAQDNKGRIYAANNEGLLVSDGVNWRKYALPKQTIMRALAILPDGRVLVGGQNEVGFFERNVRGQLQYQSLVEQLPDSLQNFADVWDIVMQGDIAYLRTSNFLLSYENRQLRVISYEADQEYRYLGVANDQIWVHIREKGLFCWRDGTLIPILNDEAWGKRLIAAVLPWEGEDLLVVTVQSGIWRLTKGQVSPWRTNHDSLLKSQPIQTACRLKGQRIALGTGLEGLLIIDAKGRVIQHLDQSKGLQDNTVRSLFIDRDQNLWLGLNYGIDLLELNSPLRRLYPDGDLRGTAYAACFFNDYLYLGTYSGLYALPWQAYYDPASELVWQLVEGTQGQVWNLQVVGDQLLMGHNTGAFVIEGTQARYIEGTDGVWTFLSPQERPNDVIAGTYQGLIHLQRGPKGLQLIGPISGMEESSRFLLEEQPGIIWMSHPYRGMFRMELSERLDHVSTVRYGSKDGLPSDLYNHVFALNQEMIVAGERGMFTFDRKQQQFVPYQDFEGVLPLDQRIIRLYEGPNGNIWYVAEEELGILWIDDKGLKKTIRRQVIPAFADQLVGGFELVYPLDDNHVFIGLEKGFLRYDPNVASGATPAWEAVVSQVVATGQEAVEMFGGYPQADSPAMSYYSYKENSIRFVCGATRYVSPTKMEFRFWLRGLDEHWSSWSDLPVKEYTNLPAGRYTFEVQARDGAGNVSQSATYPFTVEPAWYLSPGALTAYAVVLLGFLLSLVLVPRRQFEREKAELQQVYLQEQAAQQQQIELTQAQVQELERQNLEADVRHKSQELATATMHLVQKNEVMSHLRSELEQLVQKHREHPISKDLQGMVRMLGHDQQFDQDWEQFAFHFDQVHAGFLRRLSEEYPQLTPKDQRMCAYLRMNLSTKEIAPLMNISVRGVEISRYRLRKKLALSREVNLNEFMMGF